PGRAGAVRGDMLRVLYSQTAPHLARSVWLCRLLDGAALRCVRLSRRDPRESAETEQVLFDQLAAVLDTHMGNEPVEMVLPTPHWYQHLRFPPAELSAFCAPLVQRAVAETQNFLAAIAALGPVGTVLLTTSAARLPGLATALDELILSPEDESSADEEYPDFGEDLVEENV